MTTDFPRWSRNELAREALVYDYRDLALKLVRYLALRAGIPDTPNDDERAFAIRDALHAHRWAEHTLTPEQLHAAQSAGAILDEYWAIYRSLTAWDHQVRDLI
jgi:hypothetical protein